jgi:hypothetical protein
MKYAVNLFYITVMLLMFIYCDDFDYFEDLDDLCYTEVCLFDAKRLTESMSNESLAPCVDFKEFSIGGQLRNSMKNGFLFDSMKYYRARQRNILQSSIEDSDHGVVKIAKNFYQKCIDEGEL